MKEDDTEPPPEGDEESEESDPRMDIYAAIGFALLVLLLTWIFPVRRGNDWWTLEFWEIINAIGMFFLALYILKKKE